MAFVKIQVDDQALTVALQGLLKATGDLRPALRGIGEYLLESTQARIRAEGPGPAPPVLELGHLLAHHVTALADAPTEDLDVLEDRCVGQPVAGLFDRVGEPGEQRLPTRRLGPEHVVRPARGARGHRFVGHVVSPSSRGGSGTRRRRRRGAG